MEFFAAQLTSFFIAHNLVLSEQEEWCNFTITKRLEFIISLFPFLMIGIFLSGITETVLFCLAVYFLRKRTNGYHAKTFITCLILSSSLELLLLTIAPHIFSITANNNSYLCLHRNFSLCSCK